MNFSITAPSGWGKSRLIKLVKDIFKSIYGDEVFIENPTAGALLVSLADGPKIAVTAESINT